MVKYLKASHFPPTLLVSTLAFLFSRSLFSLNDSLLIWLTIFSGQLIVGWSNDLVDAESDRSDGRLNKPVATGELSELHLKIAVVLDSFMCLGLSLIGPLGLKGGTLHLFALTAAVSYNFYFKGTSLSPLPYIFAFGALPIVPYLARDSFPPAWEVLCGALFGFLAHFANVLKDTESDLIHGVNGLPQKLGPKRSLLVISISLILMASLLTWQRPHTLIIQLVALALYFFLIYKNAKQLIFYAVMALALIDVLLVTIH